MVDLLAAARLLLLLILLQLLAAQALASHVAVAMAERPCDVCVCTAVGWLCLWPTVCN